MLSFRVMSDNKLNNSPNSRGYLITLTIALIVLYLLYKAGKENWFPVN